MARYKQKSASPSPICPNMLCVLLSRATCTYSISVVTTTRKTISASHDGVPTPPTILARRYEAPNPLNHVSVLAIPTDGSNLPVWPCLFSPRCQNKSLCCQATQNKKAGRMHNVLPAPSKKSVASRIATHRMLTRTVTSAHERFKPGLSFAVLHDISHERPRKCHHPRALNLSSRNILSKSTTNRFSLSSLLLT